MTTFMKSQELLDDVMFLFSAVQRNLKSCPDLRHTYGCPYRCLCHDVRRICSPYIVYKLRDENYKFVFKNRICGILGHDNPGFLGSPYRKNRVYKFNEDYEFDEFFKHGDVILYDYNNTPNVTSVSYEGVTNYFYDEHKHTIEYLEKLESILEKSEIISK